MAIDLTPAGFVGDGADENVKRVDDAIVELDKVIRAKADLLTSLVRDHFGGIDALCIALKEKYDRDGEDMAENYVFDVRSQYEELERQHDEATESLLRAVS